MSVAFGSLSQGIFFGWLFPNWQSKLWIPWVNRASFERSYNFCVIRYWTWWRGVQPYRSLKHFAKNPFACQGGSHTLARKESKELNETQGGGW